MLAHPFDAPLSSLLNLGDFEHAARAHLTPTVYDYLAAGAADENTLRWNREGYDRIVLRPRMLRDVRTLDLSVELLGATHALPILLAPTAYHRAIHPDGELATARGAERAGVTWVVSSATTTALEAIAQETSAPRWFQLYVQEDRAITERLVRHAEAAGCTALCVTVDTPNQGARNRQTRAGFVLPPGMIAPYMGELGAGRPVTDNRRGIVITWDDIAWLRSIAKIPVLLKGILTGEDAALAVEAGVDGIIVSNHGARNLDTAPATVDALPEVARAVATRLPILIDGGIQRGTDIIKAKALGATAVLIGRPYCYGLALGGAAGVERVVEILRNELEMAMQLMGCPTFREIDAAALWER